MNKTTFRIEKLDCPSEEQMIRLKLAGLQHIRSLDFDIARRRLTVFHEKGPEEIASRLQSLDLDTSLMASEPSELTTLDDDHAQQRRLLRLVLSINLLFFFLELLFGLFSGSLGLIADSLDMLADSIVYALALMAVSGAMKRKKAIARASGFIQMVLAICGLAEVIRRFAGDASRPEFQYMIMISILALIGNVICLRLLQQSKSQEAHMKASMIFTSSDVVVNIGVISAGILVYLTASKIPDLVVGSIVFFIVGLASVKILNLAG